MTTSDARKRNAETKGPKKFRKKPVIIEAVQFTGDNVEELKAFTDGKFSPIDEDDRVDDPEMTAEVWDFLHSTWVGVYPGQWIVKGVKGEFYPIAEDVLAETYEPVE